MKRALTVKQRIGLSKWLYVNYCNIAQQFLLTLTWASLSANFDSAKDNFSNLIKFEYLRENEFLSETILAC